VDRFDEKRRLTVTRFGDLLRDHRSRRGFSQEHLAEKAGVSLEAIGSLERGSRKAPHRATVSLLVAALDLDKDETAEFETAAALGRIRIGALGRGTLNNLPAQLSSFIGRQVEVAEISQLLDDHRLITLTGTGGIGKTRLALRVAGNLLEAAFDGVWFVDLASFNEADRVPAAILSALNVAESPDRAPLQSLVAFLKNRHVLLVLDNCEHLVRETALTAKELLQRCSRVSILATSREVLGLEGERVVRLPTLSAPDALRLFIERATEADNRFATVQPPESTIVEICRHLDGIPLAIELAAARINVLSPAILAHNLNQRFQILNAGKRTAAPRHRTLRAVLDWSYDLLDEHEQRVLRKLSVFTGSFTLELATALYAQDEPIEDFAMLDVLSSLVNKSLLQSDALHETTRYRFLESTRQYAYEKLCEQSGNHATERDRALALLALAEPFSPKHVTSDRVWEAQVRPLLDNWLPALQWAFGPSGDRVIGCRLAGAHIWWQGEKSGKRWRWISRAREASDDTLPADVRASLELAGADMLLPLGRSETEEARSLAERALRIYEEIGDPFGVAMAQTWIGERLTNKGSISEGERLIHIAREAAQRAGAERYVARTTLFLGYSRGRAGDIVEARRLIREALAIYEAGACLRSFVSPKPHLAEYEFRAGNVETALDLAREAIATFRESNNWYSLGATLGNAASYSLALGCFDEARRYAREAALLAAEGEFELELAYALQHLAANAILCSHSSSGPENAELAGAARVLGFVDARVAELEATRGYTERQEYDKILDILRSTLGTELDGVMREGARWSKARALQQSLEL
jgi:predicted ATPase/DNA-binding XRE family transcriptional regulator